WRCWGSWSEGDGRWEMGDGRRETGDGRREMGDGRRETGDGRRETENGIPRERKRTLGMTGLCVSRLPSSVSRLLLQALEPLPHHRPVHHVPPRGDIVGAAVLVLEVVGVFPHIA